MAVGGFEVDNVGFDLKLKWRIPRGRFRLGGRLCKLGTQGKSDKYWKCSEFPLLVECQFYFVLKGVVIQVRFVLNRLRSIV